MINKDNFSIDLKKIIEKLRSDEGCPWDRSQTIKSLSQYIIEEVYEVYEAIENNDIDNLIEEFGDILSQVYMISQIAEENNLFTIEDVYKSINNKLLRRHPHVFGDKKAKDASEALDYWNDAKKKEKKTNIIPKNLPTLILAMKLINKTGLIYENNDKVFFDKLKVLKENIDENFLENDFPKNDCINNDINEKILRNNEENNNSKEKEFLQKEIGEILFYTIIYSLKNGINPDFALRDYLIKFFKNYKGKF